MSEHWEHTKVDLKTKSTAHGLGTYQLSSVGFQEEHGASLAIKNLNIYGIACGVSGGTQCMQLSQ